MDKNVLKILNYKDKIISRDFTLQTFIMGIVFVPTIYLLYLFEIYMFIIMLLLFINILKTHMLSIEDNKINALILYKSLGISETEYIQARYIFIIKSYIKTFIYFLLISIILELILDMNLIDGINYKFLIFLFLIPLGVSAFSIQTSIVRYNKDIGLKEHFPIKVLCTLIYMFYPLFIQYIWRYYFKC